MISVQTATLNLVDYFALGFVVLSGIIGFARGFVLEFLGICTWALSFVGARIIFPYLQPIITPYISDEMLLNGICWFVSYLSAFVLLTLIKYFTSLAVRGSNLSGVDRIIGFPLGALRGFFMLVVFLFVFSLFSMGEVPEYLSQARCFPLLNKTVQLIQQRLGICFSELKGKISEMGNSINNNEDPWSQQLENVERQVESISSPIPKHPDEE